MVQIPYEADSQAEPGEKSQDVKIVPVSQVSSKYTTAVIIAVMMIQSNWNQ
jgi:hypothetical protein